MRTLTSASADKDADEQSSPRVKPVDVVNSESSEFALRMLSTNASSLVSILHANNTPCALGAS